MSTFQDYHQFQINLRIVLNYRSDIDGLRAIAVLSVIAFHTGISIFPGGFIGVDIFFVISGYLITSQIFSEIKENKFTFLGFYKRRAARLLPALSITLFIVLLFGFVFYNNRAFDNLGKELFFSSFGAANILFAQGVNYFVNDEAYQPLLHLWSLGVEEQFYVIWPILILLIYRFLKKIIIPTTLILLFMSLGLSIYSVAEGDTKGYFLLQYRAFELLIGCLTPLLSHQYGRLVLTHHLKSLLNFIGIALVMLPVFALTKNSNFPGLNALWPCLGTSLVIAFPNKNGFVTKALSNRSLVYIGLISYPLYLFHQPLISFLYFFDVQLSSYERFLIVTVVAISLSWLTYRYVENPIRKAVRLTQSKRSNLTLIGLTATIPLFFVLGLLIAKSGGFEKRFSYLNPFALEISEANASTFQEHFVRGYNVTQSDDAKVLFVGDSVLQQYVLPISKALKLNVDNIDTVTRGGCVLLKGTNFVDKFADISCNDLREDLYKIKKTYDQVIISQAWESYGSSVLNFSESNDAYARWMPLLTNTIEHFLKISDEVIVIAAHPKVEGTSILQPTIAISKDSYLSNLKELVLLNKPQLEDSVDFFTKYDEIDNVTVIEPYRIFCNDKCIFSDDKWSYYSDKRHISSASTSFVESRLFSLFAK